MHNACRHAAQTHAHPIVLLNAQSGELWWPTLYTEDI